MNHFFHPFLLAIGLVFTIPSYASLTAIPSIEISKEESLVDQEIKIKLTKLRPHEKIEIQAQAIDVNNTYWQSFGLFQANNRGEIDLSKQAPIQGSYQGIEPMGLLWSMQPFDLEKGTSFKMKKEGFSVELTAYREAQEIASRKFFRLRKAPEVKKILVRENGLVGALFLPPSKKPLPVIITLNGSNGGFGENRAQLLASYGFAVLALGYFGTDGLPPSLGNIPLEYFETAFTWLKQQPAINGSQIGLYGISRGAELALILGSWFPHAIKAIVAVVPSSVIHGSFETPGNAWTYRGKPLAPFAPISPIDFSEGKGKSPHCPVEPLQSFLEGMKNQATEASAIPVERICAPLLLISGGDDQMWPSALYTANIQKRLKEKNSPIVYQHLHYPKAGHGITIPNLPQLGPVYYHPVGKHWLHMGGTPAEDQRASQDSWKKIISFFKDSLKT